MRHFRVAQMKCADVYVYVDVLLPYHIFMVFTEPQSNNNKIMTDADCDIVRDETFMGEQDAGIHFLNVFFLVRIPSFMWNLHLSFSAVLVKSCTYTLVR